MLFQKYCSSILLFMLLLLAGAAAAVAIQPLPSAVHPTAAATAAAASRRSRCRKELSSPLHREAHSEPDSLQNYLSLWSNTAKPNACDSVTRAAL